MGQLAERLAFLTRRYGSDKAAWQHELHALAALEETDAKAALDRFHLLKRRLAEFRRAQLLRELRSFSFVRDVPEDEARGYAMKEVEADIRDATRALAHARAIEAARAAEAEARASLRHRTMPPPTPIEPARWDALRAVADEAEARRRAAAREARLDRRYAEAKRRAAKLTRGGVALPAPTLEGDALDAALEAAERDIARTEDLEEAWRAAVAPLRAPEVRTFRDASRRKLEREADALASAGDVDGLRALAARGEALRREAAGLAGQAARARRSGAPPPLRERRPGDGIDPYG